jgi:predicted transcriptional regulator
MPSAYSISAIRNINSTAKDLLIYLFDLSPLEIDLLLILIKTRKFMTLEQLSQKIDRDKSTGFRSLQKLVSLGICIKETKTLQEGGYYHVYSAIDIETLKMEAEKRVKELKESFDRLLRKFQNDMDKAIVSL